MTYDGRDQTSKLFVYSDGCTLTSAEGFPASSGDTWKLLFRLFARAHAGSRLLALCLLLFVVCLFVGWLDCLLIDWYVFHTFFHPGCFFECKQPYGSSFISSICRLFVSALGKYYLFLPLPPSTHRRECLFFNTEFMVFCFRFWTNTEDVDSI